MQQLIEVGADLDQPDADGCTPLILAVSQPQASRALIKFLLTSGAALDCRNNVGGTAVTIYICLVTPHPHIGSSNSLPAAPLLLHLLKHSQSKGRTAAAATSGLLLAALLGDTGVMQALLDAGADPNVADNQQHTALFTCASLDNKLVAQQLLAAGANVNKADKEGCTPLILAVREAYSCKQPEAHPQPQDDMVALLLQAGATAGLKDKEGLSAMAYAAKGKGALALQHPKLLLSSSKHRALDATAALPHAVAAGAVDAVGCLLAAGASAQANCACEKTCSKSLLHMAVDLKSQPSAVMLLKAGSAVVPSDASKLSKVFAPAHVDNQMVRLLALALNTAPPAPAAAQLKLSLDNPGLSLGKPGASLRTCTAGRYGSGWTCLHEAAEQGLAGAVKLTADSMGPKGVNCKDSTGTTPLHVAARQLLPKQALEQLQQQLVQHSTAGRRDNRAVLAPATEQYSSVMTVLLEAKADVHVCSNARRTPLHLAAGSGNVLAVQQLLEHSAHVDADDILSQSALIHAVRHAAQNNCKATQKVLKVLIDMLLQTGADPGAMDRYSQSALHYALKWGDTDCGWLLQRLLHARPEAVASTALQTALDLHHLAGVKYALAAGANPDVKAADGQPQLVSATQIHSTLGDSIILELLHAGAFTNVKDRRGRTVLQCAAAAGRDVVVRKLLVVGPLHNEVNNAALHAAVKGGHASTVRLLLAAGVDAEATDAEGSAPLYKAVAKQALLGAPTWCWH